MEQNITTTKAKTSTKTLVGWALVAAAIVAAALLMRKTVWKVQVMPLPGTVQMGPTPLPGTQ